MLGRIVFTAAAVLASTARASPAQQLQATPGPTLQGRDIQERQQAPFSIPGVNPSAVDTRFYSKDGSTTKFIGSTSAYLSVPTVTITSSGKTTTTTQTASMAIYSAIPEGQTEYEYSFVMCPQLAEEVFEIMMSENLSTSSTSTKRGLDKFDATIPGIGALLWGLFSSKGGSSILGALELGAGNLLTTGFDALAGFVVEIGGLTVLGTALIGAVVNQFKYIYDVVQNYDPLHLDAVVVDNPFKNFRDYKTCPKTIPDCSSCDGKMSMCTAGDNKGCPCKNACKQGTDRISCTHPQCKGDDTNICTVGDQKGCECQIINPAILHPVLPDFSWLDEQQAYFQSIIKAAGGPPSNRPSCGSLQSMGLAGLKLPGHNMLSDGSNATPRQILYMMRETLCNDKCENPPKIPMNSVKTTPKGTDGCEISIAIASNIEAWAVRDTHSQGSQWQECWDSFANATEKCAKMESQDDGATGWVNGPNDYQFYQIGYRSLNHAGALHSSFSANDALPQWCGDSKPKCDTCNGGASNNRCTQGEFSGCDCEPVKATQPSPPKPTNCATAVAAADIVCCGWSDDTKATCANMISGCGVNANLAAICQSPVDASGGGTYDVCGQSTKSDPIVKGSRGEEIADCLNKAFNLGAQFKYA
ncbi:hypothetical protein F5Y13DRAFT_202191 [Hypoxylon sp. FL1857]|nr:hypothetical protein F5Y13DRAFT_202191 [Hypoxylon sp. FL1857]